MAATLVAAPWIRKAGAADLQTVKLCSWSPRLAEEGNIFVSEAKGFFKDQGLEIEWIPGAGSDCPMAAGVTRTRSARSRFSKPENCRACTSRWPSNKSRTVPRSTEASAGGIGTGSFVEERDLEFG